MYTTLLQIQTLKIKGGEGGFSQISQMLDEARPNWQGQGD